MLSATYSVTYKPFMLSVIMLNVVMLSVVVPTIDLYVVVYIFLTAIQKNLNVKGTHKLKCLSLTSLSSQVQCNTSLLGPFISSKENKVL